MTPTPLTSLVFFAHTTPKKAGHSLHGSHQTPMHDPRHRHRHPSSEVQLVLEVPAAILVTRAQQRQQAVEAAVSVTSGPTIRAHNSRSRIAGVYDEDWQGRDSDVTGRKKLSRGRARCWLRGRCQVREPAAIRVLLDSRGEAPGHITEGHR